MSNRFQPSHTQLICPHPSHSSPSSPGSVMCVQCAWLKNAKSCSISSMRSSYKVGLLAWCLCLKASLFWRRRRSSFLRNSSTWSSRLESRHVWSLSLGSTHLLLWLLVSTPGTIQSRFFWRTTKFQELVQISVRHSLTTKLDHYSSKWHNNQHPETPSKTHGA